MSWPSLAKTTKDHNYIIICVWFNSSSRIYLKVIHGYWTSYLVPNHKTPLYRDLFLYVCLQHIYNIHNTQHIKYGIYVLYMLLSRHWRLLFCTRWRGWVYIIKSESEISECAGVIMGYRAYSVSQSVNCVPKHVFVHFTAKLNKAYIYIDEKPTYLDAIIIYTT